MPPCSTQRKKVSPICYFSTNLHQDYAGFIIKDTKITQIKIGGDPIKASMQVEKYSPLSGSLWTKSNIKQL